MMLANNEFTARTAQTDTVTTDANWAMFRQYLKATKECDGTTVTNDKCWDVNGEKAYIAQPVSNVPAFIDVAGRAWSLYNADENIYLLDVNAFNPPNKYGQDRWMFSFYDKDNTRVGSAGSEYIPTKVLPLWDDRVVYNEHWCKTPPCYYCTYLFDVNSCH